MRTITKDYIHFIYLSAVIIIGAVLRFYDLSGESYWYDEIITLEVVKDSIESIVHGSRPQLYLFLAHFWIKIVGTSEVATRSLSVLAGLFAIPVIYLVGKELFNRRVGLISSFLMAVSQFQIYYSQEFRYYSLFVLLTLISFYFFIIYLKTLRSRWLICYVISTILLYYSHDFGVFSIAAQALYYFITAIRGKKNYYLLISFGVICLPIIPAILNFIKKVGGNSSGSATWLPEPSFFTPLITLRNYIGAGLDYPSWTTLIAGLVFFIVAITIFIIWQGKQNWLRSLRNIQNDNIKLLKNKEILLLLLWLLIPILIPFILSILLSPIYHHRYTIGASPAFYLLLAIIIIYIRRIAPEIITLGLFLIIITPGLYEFYKTPVREQWREAALYIKSNIKKDDIIIFDKDLQNFKNFSWYYKNNFDQCEVNQHNSYEVFLKEVKKCTKEKDRFWLVVREVPNPIPEELRSKIENNNNELLNLIEVKKFTKITLYLFNLDNNGS